MSMKYVSEQIVLRPSQTKETFIKKAGNTDAKYVLGYGERYYGILFRQKCRAREEDQSCKKQAGRRNTGWVAFFLSSCLEMFASWSFGSVACPPLSQGWSGDQTHRWIYIPDTSISYACPLVFLLSPLLVHDVCVHMYVMYSLVCVSVRHTCAMAHV